MRRIKDKEVKKFIGYVIRHNRIRQNITQQKLAEDAKLSITFLNLVECGHRIPSFETLERIALRFGKETGDLIAETNSSDVLSKDKLINLVDGIIKEGNKKTIEKINSYIESLSAETQ